MEVCGFPPQIEQMHNEISSFFMDLLWEFIRFNENLKNIQLFQYEKQKQKYNNEISEK